MANNGRFNNVNAIVLMTSVGRIVNVVSIAAIMAFHEMSGVLKAHFRNPKLSLQDLDQLMSSFVK